MKKRVLTFLKSTSLCSLLVSTVLTACLVPYSSKAQVPNYVPTSGLVGWWPFNGNANDESGNGNNGTPLGPVLSEDRFGIASSSFMFNGNTDIITTSESFVMGSTLTVSFWTKVDSISSAWLVVQGANQSGISYNFDLGAGLSEIGILKQYVFNGTENWIGEDTLLAEGNWYHIAYCMSEQGMQLYLNSFLVASNPLVTSNQNLSGFWRFGGCTHPDQISLIGNIDDIGIWNRALSPCEIADLYNAQLGSANTSSTVTQAACGSYSWNGNTYVQSGQYTFLTTNAQGCDSTATLNLTINQSTTSSQTQSALDSYTWPVNGQTFTQSGTYTTVIPNAAGCDSTITLNLTLNFTGLEELQSNAIKLYPNPSSDLITLELANELVGQHFMICNELGQVVLEGTLSADKMSVKVGEFAPGTYVFKSAGGHAISFSVIRE